MSSAISNALVSRFHPLRDNVLIRCRFSETTTAGGVMIPDTVRRKPNRGSVVAVGPGLRTQEGTRIPPSVAPGDEVALEDERGVEVTIAGEQLVVISERDVLGIFSAAVHQDQPAPATGQVAEPISERERGLSRAARDESLETDVAPDLLDREPPTGEDLH